MPLEILRIDGNIPRADAVVRPADHDGAFAAAVTAEEAGRCLVIRAALGADDAGLRAGCREVCRLAAERGARSLILPVPEGGEARKAYRAMADEARLFLQRERSDMRIILLLPPPAPYPDAEDPGTGVARYIRTTLILPDDEAEYEMSPAVPPPVHEKRSRIFGLRTGGKRRAESVAAKENIFDTGRLPSLQQAPFDLDVRAEDLDKSFGEMVSWWIEEKDMRPSEFYTKANLTKATFSNIKNHPERVPKKTTALACVIGLELDLQQANDLLRRAGLTISHSNLTDVIVEYFILHGKYDIDEINLVLYERDLAILGARNE